MNVRRTKRVFKTNVLNLLNSMTISTRLSSLATTLDKTDTSRHYDKWHYCRMGIYFHFLLQLLGMEFVRIPNLEGSSSSHIVDRWAMDVSKGKVKHLSLSYKLLLYYFSSYFILVR